MHKNILRLSWFTIPIAIFFLFYPRMPVLIQKSIEGSQGGDMAVLLMVVVGIISTTILTLCLKWYMNETGPYEGSAVATITLASFIGVLVSASGLLKIYGIWATPYLVVHDELVPIMQTVLIIAFAWYLVILATCTKQTTTTGGG